MNELQLRIKDTRQQVRRTFLLNIFIMALIGAMILMYRHMYPWQEIAAGDIVYQAQFARGKQDIVIQLGIINRQTGDWSMTGEDSLPERPVVPVRVMIHDANDRVLTDTTVTFPAASLKPNQRVLAKYMISKPDSKGRVKITLLIKDQNRVQFVSWFTLR